ncbi:hypothetical protein Psi02_13800 [Planotetraspora silvatica]|uniref:Uncharacterized protein n=1 Tax=Planotetraspora silvatica TaxID=234614 RepID=A0A8J3UKJ8_9ACTN|nr:hypothetical protein [Planotetraspora silvatica]GII44956.1 hypothetical protein Psi02_13800 [Planotetraspora silvatica]
MNTAADTSVLLARGSRKEKGEGSLRAVDGVDLDIGPGDAVGALAGLED